MAVLRVLASFSASNGRAGFTVPSVGFVWRIGGWSKDRSKRRMEDGIGEGNTVLQDETE